MLISKDPNLTFSVWNKCRLRRELSSLWISLYSVVKARCKVKSRRPHFVLQKRVKGKSKSCAPSGCQLIDLGRRSKREYPGDLHAPYCPLYKHRLGWGHLFLQNILLSMIILYRNTTGSGWSLFLNKYILFLIIKFHYVRHNKAFNFLLSVRLQVKVITKKIKNVQWEFSRWRNWLKRRFIWWWRRANHLPHYITRNILDFFCDALIHEIFISQKQELDLHRFVKTRYTRVQNIPQSKIYKAIYSIGYCQRLQMCKIKSKYQGAWCWEEVCTCAQ